MRIFERILLAIAVAAGGVGVWARLHQLSQPVKQIFDEVYFPVFANNYLHGIHVFDVHPPLGKFLIAGGIALFGDTTFGWRIVPALLGILLVGLIPYFWLRYQKDVPGALMLLGFVAVEPILIVYSRTGLMDGIQLFFIFACLLGAVWAQKRRHLLGLALLLGMAASIKWVALGVIIPVAYIVWRKGLIKPFLASLGFSAVLYVLIVFIGQVLNGESAPWSAVIEWHNQAFRYHLLLTATHPWSSAWYSWPLLTRPVLFLYDVDPDSRVRVMTSIGNPLLWWASTGMVIASLIEVVSLASLKQKVLDHPLVPLLLGYAACFLPWIGVHRVVFIYHYLPSYAFAMLITAYWLGRWWKKYPAAVLALFIGFMVIGLYFLPFAMGLPLTDLQLKEHIWINSWLYGESA